MSNDGSGCEIPRVQASLSEIDRLLQNYRRVAVVGLSPKSERPSHRVAAYLKEHGYHIIPVNPGHSEILGEKTYSSLRDIPEQVEIVDVFRTPEAVPGIVDDAIHIRAKALWLQEGIVHNEAAAKAQAAGLIVVMNRCMLKEHVRFSRGAERS